MADDCIFCKIIRGEIPATKIYEDEQNLVFRDINPAAPVHLLAIPKRHVNRLSECGQESSEMLSSLLLTVNKAAALEKLDDFRVVINNGAGAGQTVFHLHVHILGGMAMSERLL
jgi:Diadenosine tetraphosphate (Ap4A) hydrolase and other HIT family hydrolases